MKTAITHIFNFSKHKLSKSFVRTFALLVSAYFLLSGMFAIFAYYNSWNALQNEFLSSTKQQTYTVASTADSNIRNARLVMATLYNNSRVHAFMVSENADELLSGNTDILKDELNSFKNTFNQIDSLYLYSPASNAIISNNVLDNSVFSMDRFPDSNWMEHIETAPENNYFLYLRLKPPSDYPVITLLKTQATSRGLAAIVINIDLSKVEPLSSFAAGSNEKIYIISDEGQILYRYNQKAYFEPLSAVPELINFDALVSEKQILVGGDSPYIYTQYHSSNYPWSYVMVTSVSAYTARLGTLSKLISFLLIFSITVAMVIIFIILFRSNKPFRTIVNLLEKPNNFAEKDIDVRDPENQEIIQKILTYIQSSTTLSSELDAKLKLLNDAKMLALQTQINPHFLLNTLNTIHMIEVDALGYSHEVPRMTITLCRLLRYALEGEYCVPLSTEIAYAEQFAQLINKRYRGVIQFTFEAPSEVLDVLLPKLVLQPLIENAIFHGLSIKKANPENSIEVANNHDSQNESLYREKEVHVSASLSGDFCYLTVWDNGTGIPAGKIEELAARISDYEKTPVTSIGLHNVMLRMHLLYGDAFSFRIESRTAEVKSNSTELDSLGILEHGTAIILKFPGKI